MNDLESFDFIKAATLSTQNMLHLCEQAVGNYTNHDHHLRMVGIFVHKWMSANPTASLKDLMDVVATCSRPVQAITIYAIAPMMSRTDFEYGFKTLSCTGALRLAAGASGKYTQEEVFTFGDLIFENEYSTETLPRYWRDVVNASVLDADGLYRIGMWQDYESAYPHTWDWVQVLAAMVLEKNMLNAEQVMNICKKHNCFGVTFTAIRTGVLSDDQILSLEPTDHSSKEVFWREAIQQLRLEDRTSDELATLARKTNNPQLSKRIVEVVAARVK